MCLTTNQHNVSFAYRAEKYLIYDTWSKYSLVPRSFGTIEHRYVGTFMLGIITKIFYRGLSYRTDEGIMGSKLNKKLYSKSLNNITKY